MSYLLISPCDCRICEYLPLWLSVFRWISTGFSTMSSSKSSVHIICGIHSVFLLRIDRKCIISIKFVNGLYPSSWTALQTLQTILIKAKLHMNLCLISMLDTYSRVSSWELSSFIHWTISQNVEAHNDHFSSVKVVFTPSEYSIFQRVKCWYR